MGFNLVDPDLVLRSISHYFHCSFIYCHETSGRLDEFKRKFNVEIGIEESEESSIKKRQSVVSNNTVDVIGDKTGKVNRMMMHECPE